MSRSLGLRLKFNLVLVPTVTLGIASIVWADYRHEFATLMEAHAVHVSRVGTGATAGPMDPWTLPDAATQRSLRLHAVAGGVLLVVVVIVVNLTLQGLVLRPIASMRMRIAELEHGHWRGQEEGATSGRDDEVGALYEGFRRLGSEIDALVGQLLRADRLATLALVSKRIEARVEPEVRRIGEVAGRLTSGQPTDSRAEGELLGRAAANILHAVHEYDAVFVQRTGARARENRRTRDAAYQEAVHHMETIHDQLVRRVQAEYREMPGLCLTRRQAQRLLGLDDTDFTAVFQTLVASGFLCETHRGCFVSGNERADDRHGAPPSSGVQSRRAGQLPGGINSRSAVS